MGKTRRRFYSQNMYPEVLNLIVMDGHYVSMEIIMAKMHQRLQTAIILQLIRMGYTQVINAWGLQSLNGHDQNTTFSFIGTLQAKGIYLAYTVPSLFATFVFIPVLTGTAQDSSTLAVILKIFFSVESKRLSNIQSTDVPEPAIYTYPSEGIVYIVSGINIAFPIIFFWLFVFYKINIENSGPKGPFLIHKNTF